VDCLRNPNRTHSEVGGMMGYPTMARVRIFDFVKNAFSEIWCDTYSEALKLTEQKSEKIFYFIDVVEVIR
jgi:hypothetical protein